MKNRDVIIIRDYAAISALGDSKEILTTEYTDSFSRLSLNEVEGVPFIVAKIPDSSNIYLEKIKDNPLYKKLDRSVLMAMYVARRASESLSSENARNVLINIGSSRGATSLFEQYYRSFLHKGNVPVQTSPTTTLGNISSWVAQDLNCRAFSLSTSVTCSTALQSIVNSIAWLKSEMADIAIAGGAEAALTGFTIAQMQALRIYADNFDLKYPCQPCAIAYDNGSGMALGEAAAVFVLEKVALEKAILSKQVILESFGFGREQIQHSTAISDDGDSLFQSMSMCLSQLQKGDEIDLILLHAPGTIRGDASELEAVRRVFGPNLPILLSNKWKLGHTFGAAGALNLEHALNILKYQSYAEFPYATKFKNQKKDKIRRIMINSAGFGGNATSLVLLLPD